MLYNGGLGVTSGFRRGVNEICALQGFYAAYNGSLSPMFRDNLPVPSSGVKSQVLDCLILEDGTDRLS
jgi:hypothetical protein